MGDVTLLPEKLAGVGLQRLRGYADVHVINGHVDEAAERWRRQRQALLKHASAILNRIASCKR